MNKIFMFSGIFLLILSGCDSGGSDDDSGGIIPVSYSLNCNTEPTCKNVSEKTGYTTGSYSSVRCAWHCSSYNRQEGVYVVLNFGKFGNGCWSLEGEHISAGICK